MLDVRDELCPWNAGRWRARGRRRGPTDAAADLALDVAALGAAYLGGVRFARLAQGGQVEELEAGRDRASRRPLPPGLHPWCPEIF